jgi:hypothetical protein
MSVFLKMPVHFKRAHAQVVPSLAISLVVYREICAVLQRYVGFSFSESQLAVQRHLALMLDASVFDAVVFAQAHATLVKLGYLRQMGKCVDYDKTSEVTYCWNSTPESAAYFTDLLVVLEVNQQLKNRTTSTSELVL